jgi:hypothetical protein
MDGTEQVYGWTPAFAGVTGFYLIGKQVFFTTVDAKDNNQKTVIPGLVPGIHVITPVH